MVAISGTRLLGDDPVRFGDLVEHDDELADRSDSWTHCYPCRDAAWRVTDADAGVAGNAAERDHRGHWTVLSQELLARDLTRLAYIAKDGTPRTIPIGFMERLGDRNVHGEERREAPRALRHNPAVALTIDTEAHLPKILLIRGRAELDVVEGIPDEYLEMNGTYQMTPEQRVEWENAVPRSTMAWFGSL